VAKVADFGEWALTNSAPTVINSARMSAVVCSATPLIVYVRSLATSVSMCILAPWHCSLARNAAGALR
jgi:hypothetical protein